MNFATSSTLIRSYFLQISFVYMVSAGQWMKKSQEPVKSNNIIEQINEIGITSCQLKCKNNKQCNSFGMEKDVALGGVIDCFLLQKDDVSSTGYDTKNLYVIKLMKGCTNSKCRTDQKCVEKKHGHECICKNGSQRENCEIVYTSCNDLKKKHPTFGSGLYKINPSKPVTVFCDLEHGAGWMLIANISIPRPITAQEAIKITDRSLISNDISQLDQVASGRFRLYPTKLDDFDSKFNYLWFYCNKPKIGRTISIRTIKKEVLDYFMKKTVTRPRACASFERDTNVDNSRLAIQCGLWDSGGKWSSGLYIFPFYKPGSYHYGLSGSRLECDDQDLGGGVYGVWKIYVS